MEITDIKSLEDLQAFLLETKRSTPDEIKQDSERFCAYLMSEGYSDLNRREVINMFWEGIDSTKDNPEQCKVALDSFLYELHDEDCDYKDDIVQSFTVMLDEYFG